MSLTLSLICVSECFSTVSEDQNGTVHFTLTEETKHFVELYKNFTLCIHKNVRDPSVLFILTNTAVNIKNDME